MDLLGVSCVRRLLGVIIRHILCVIALANQKYNFFKRICENVDNSFGCVSQIASNRTFPFRLQHKLRASLGEIKFSVR